MDPQNSQHVKYIKPMKLRPDLWILGTPFQEKPTLILNFNTHIKPIVN